MGKGNNQGLFKSIINVIKKNSEQSSLEREEKKKKKVKPKGYGMKKFGMITFWVLFSFMFIVLVINLIQPSSKGARQEQHSSYQADVTSHEALEFTKDFLYHYFTWDNNRVSKERRTLNLSPYLMYGIDDLGGIVIDDGWESEIDKRNIVLKDVEKINEERARLTFRVQFNMKKETDKKDTKVDYEKHRKLEEVIAEEENRIQDGYEIKEVKKYISVPIVSYEGRFSVYDLPSFTYVDEEKLDKHSVEIENVLIGLDKLQDRYLESNIEAFLETFFESYSSDSRDKLSYILEDEKYQDGLSETMDFSEITYLEIYEGDLNERTFVVDTEVVLLDPDTEVEFKSKYLLVVERKDQRYVVSHINNENEVENLKQKMKEDDEELTEEQINKNDNEEVLEQEDES